MSNPKEYLLGISENEIERLRFQHKVWKPITDKFLDGLKIMPGWKCLDVGAGPGLVTMDMLDRVGESGEVTALEPSQLYLDYLRNAASAAGFKNIKLVQGNVENSTLPGNYYDLILVRWVVAFVPDPEQFLLKLIKALSPGGILAIEDYWYEGLSLYPRGTAFERMPDVIRAYYHSGGGDPYVTGRIPSLLRREGLRLIDFSPHQLVGGPDSGVFEWAHRFLVPHLPLMAERGVITKEECTALLADWHRQRANPDAIYFSPILVDVAGRKDF